MLQKRTGPATGVCGARRKQNLQQGSSAAQNSHLVRATQAPSGSPPDLEPAKSSLCRVSVALRCEESDYYARVIARLKTLPTKRASRGHIGGRRNRIARTSPATDEFVSLHQITQRVLRKLYAASRERQQS
jgi:hypothetical protein